eukprot:570656-Amphidinium_carterae.4
MCIRDRSSESASLLVHLSMAAAEHPRFVAALTREQYRKYLVGWRPSGSDPIPRQLGAASLLLRAWLLQRPLLLAIRRAWSSLTLLRFIADPSREHSRPVISQNEVEAVYRTYIKAMGGPPAPYEKATQ